MIKRPEAYIDEHSGHDWSASSAEPVNSNHEFQLHIAEVDETRLSDVISGYPHSLFEGLVNGIITSFQLLLGFGR